jgi:putative ABC transport system ATP-binding protein
MCISELKEVSKTYGHGATCVHALEKASVCFSAGEFTVISGPSGSGKTTMLNLVGLLDVPSTGSVHLANHHASQLDSGQLSALRAAHIGFVFQSFNLIPVLTALENVEMALHLARVGGDKKQRAAAALETVGLGALLHRRPSELSGGQQQRVAIARALVKNPSLVIADEPTANLDSKTGSQILELMRQMNDEQGITFVFSTHDPMVISRARRVLSLHDGRIVSDDVREDAAISGDNAASKET